MTYLLTGVRACLVRPAIPALVALIIGIMLGVSLSVQSYYWLGCMIVGVMLLIWGGYVGYLPKIGGVAWFVVLVSWGAFGVQQKNETLPSTPSHGVCFVTICGAPVARASGVSVEAIVSSTSAHDAPWLGRKILIELPSSYHSIRPREQYRIEDTVLPVSKSSVYRERQYALMARGIEGVVKPGKLAQEKTETCPTYLSWWQEVKLVAYRAQQKAAQTFDRNASLDVEQRSLLKSICLGDRTAYTTSAAQMRSIGVAHILSVSGFHVGVVLSLLYWLLRYPVRLLRRPRTAYLLRWGITLLVVWLYAFVCGLSIPTLRATVMVSIFVIARLSMRQSDDLHTWAVSALLLLLVSPYSLFDIGFQLSYAAVFAIIVCWRALNALRDVRMRPFFSFVYHLMLTTVMVQIFIWPLLAIHFSTTSVWWLLSNLLVVPVSSVLIILGLSGVLLSILGQQSLILSSLLGWASDLNGDLLDLLARYFSDQIIISMPWWIYVLYYLLLYMWFHFLFYRQKRYFLSRK